MRFKTLVEPKTVSKGDEWLSPDGYSSSWRRVWNGTSWVENLKVAGFPTTQTTPVNTDLSGAGTPTDEPPVDTGDLGGNTDEDFENDTDEDGEEDTEEDFSDGKLINKEEDLKPTEETKDEQGMSTKIPDRNGTEQGTVVKPESKQEQRGKRGKVRKGRKGK